MNPLRGILINGFFFDYVSDSFREQVSIRNKSYETLGATKGFSILGKSKEVFSLTVGLNSTYSVKFGDNIIGQTTWVGASRISHLKDIIGAEGVSNPITFVTPYGATYLCVPTGVLDFSIFNPDNPNNTNGVEFRASLTLEVQ